MSTMMAVTKSDREKFQKLIIVFPFALNKLFFVAKPTRMYKEVRQEYMIGCFHPN